MKVKKLILVIFIILTLSLTNSISFAEVIDGSKYGLITKNLIADGQADFETSIAVQDKIDVTGNISVNSSNGNPASAVEPQLIIGHNVNNAKQACTPYKDTNGDGKIGDGDAFSWNSYIDKNKNNANDTGDGLITTSKGNYVKIDAVDDLWFDDEFQYADGIVKCSKDVVKFKDVAWNTVPGLTSGIIVLISEDITNFTQMNDQDGRKISNKVTFISQMSQINIIGSQLYGNFYSPNSIINISGSNICGQVICDTWKVANGAEVHMPNKGVIQTPEPYIPAPPNPNTDPEQSESSHIPETTTLSDVEISKAGTVGVSPITEDINDVKIWIIIFFAAIFIIGLIWMTEKSNSEK